ncbi:hypothetical protein HaLaN_14830 [Haematococcus lacustris]|uniref:Uncharacterized protein n=1 Tax=Haematococcus lacustris TaxID=44745 RepID=A0A699Z645_HAELA|nr:hypothetical protein HaLaN_14830 [Haematococcus lacustris]
MTTHHADVCLREGLGGAANLGQHSGGVSAPEHGQLPQCPVPVVVVALRTDPVKHDKKVSQDINIDLKETRGRCAPGDGREGCDNNFGHSQRTLSRSALCWRNPPVADDIVNLASNLVGGQRGQGRGSACCVAAGRRPGRARFREVDKGAHLLLMGCQTIIWLAPAVETAGAALTLGFRAARTCTQLRAGRPQETAELVERAAMVAIPAACLNVSRPSDLDY